MLAADTNVLIRLITRDDEAQYLVAVSLFEDGPIHVSLTVLLETAWVLQHTLRWSRSAVAVSLRGLLQHEMMVVENEDAAEWATDRYEEGADFGDMIHLAANREMSGFATFDRKIAKHAGDNGPIPVVVLGP